MGLSLHASRIKNNIHRNDQDKEDAWMMYCQKCRTPLKLDSSLEGLNPAAYNLLVGSSTNSTQQSKTLLSLRPAYPQERKALYDRVSKDASSPSFKRRINSSLHEAPIDETTDTLKAMPMGNPAMSFVMLSESEVVQPTLTKPPEMTLQPEQDNPQALDGIVDEDKARSHEMARVSRLFEIMSARSDIDHPICVECTELLVDGLQRRLEAATRERDAYVGFLKQVNSSIPTAEEVAESQAALKKAQDEEAAATAILLELEAEKATVDAEVAALEAEALALDAEEEAFWRSRNAFATKLSAIQSTLSSVVSKHDHDAAFLEKLQRTNVYNDTFCISHDGSFGTINGLRLGRMSNIPVDWPEINAAWGHALLLLSTIAARLGFEFQGYELVPMGSTSRIHKIETHPSPANSRTAVAPRPPKKTVLELYSSGDMPFGLTIMHRHFDTAMVAFLECMRQLGDFVEAETSRGHPSGADPRAGERSGLKLPYRIEGDKIGDVSIKLGIAQDDAWSKACKFTLTCCKFLLAHASNVNSAGGRRA